MQNLWNRWPDRLYRRCRAIFSRSTCSVVDDSDVIAPHSRPSSCRSWRPSSRRPTIPMSFCARRSPCASASVRRASRWITASGPKNVWKKPSFPARNHIDQIRSHIDQKTLQQIKFNSRVTMHSFKINLYCLYWFVSSQNYFRVNNRLVLNYPRWKLNYTLNVLLLILFSIFDFCFKLLNIVNINFSLFCNS